MAKKTLDDCRTWKDLTKWASKQERSGKCKIKEGGSHIKIYTDDCERPVTLSRGSGELSRGFRKTIIKQLGAIGLGILALIAIFC